MKSSLLLVVAALAFMAPNVLAAPKNSKCYSGSKTVAFTNYWTAKEGTTDMDNDGKTVHLSGPKNVAIKDSRGKTIIKVSKTTFEKCQMEGTCLLQNGMMLNLDDGNNRFKILDRQRRPYGEGYAETIPLIPFVSIAANDIKRQAHVFIKELAGIKLPNGRTHNGCVRVDDDSWSFDGCQIDWFVLEFPFYEKLNTPEKVHAEVKNCKILDYITPGIRDWALIGKKPKNGTDETGDSKKDDKKGSKKGGKKGKKSKN